MKYITVNEFGNIVSIHSEDGEGRIAVDTTLSDALIFNTLHVIGGSVVVRDEPLTPFHKMINGEWILDEVAKLNSEIAALEGSVTPRRLREALLGDLAFIAMIDSEIAQKREQLNGLRSGM